MAHLIDKSRDMKIVKIEWVDSRQMHGWVLEEDIDTSACYINTCGYLIKETDETFTVAVSVGEEPKQANGINVIPKCCVVNYEEIIKGE